MSVERPIHLHLDRKLLPVIDWAKKKTVKQIEIIVSGNRMEKLLGVTKITRVARKEQVLACI